MDFAATTRRAALALAAAFALAGSAAAQTPADQTPANQAPANPAPANPAYDGDWAGSLQAGGQTLRLELHVKTAGGATTGVLDSLDQGATIPASAVKTEGGELNILFLSIGGELKAKLSTDGKTLAGSWEQGATLPLTLTKK
jgi:hypothetical protein